MRAGTSSFFGQACRRGWRRLRGAARALRACRGGAVLVEFAIALPVLIALYLLAFITADMIAANRKVTIATRALADLTTRSSLLTTSDLNTIMAASQQVLAPYDYDNAMVRVSEIEIGSNNVATVIWSQALNGTALTVGNTFTVSSSLGSSGTYLVLCEVNYGYVPPIGLGAQSTVNLYDSIYMGPRLTSSITLTTS